MNTPSTPHARARQVALSSIFALILAACGNEPSAATPPQPTETPSAAPAPAAAPRAPTAAPTASASAKASAAPAPPKAEGSGRPAVLKSDPSEITDTFGSSPASKLELGDKDIATLRLPEGGLHTGTVVTFKIDKSGKSNGGLLGRIYQIKSIIPPSSTPEQIDSNGPPFILELPVGSKKDANLAIGVEDDKRQAQVDDRGAEARRRLAQGRDLRAHHAAERVAARYLEGAHRREIASVPARAAAAPRDTAAPASWRRGTRSPAK